jgi:diguanylate cyclase (GGDEF)-like protein
VLISTAGAFPLPIFAFIAPSFIRPGGMKFLVVIWLFTAVSFAATLFYGKLNDRQFAILGFGGMIGIAWSAYLVTDAAAARAIVALLAAIPAIAAMGSTRRVTAVFTLVAVCLAVLLSIVGSTSVIATLVAGGAAVITVLVPVFMVAALRRSLGVVLANVAKLSATDPLTGLLNRRGFVSRTAGVLNEIDRSKQSIGFMMIDIDNFKSVNDTFGHAFGDSELVATANAIDAAVPKNAITSRFGGEEFVVLCGTNNAEELRALADGVRTQVTSECTVTISIGAVYAPLHRSTEGTPNVEDIVDSLTRVADKAVYSAKDEGRDRVTTTTAPRVKWVPGPPSKMQMEINAAERMMSVVALIRRPRDHATAIDGDV